MAPALASTPKYSIDRQRHHREPRLRQMRDDDLDGDGFALRDDCDDNDPSVNPDAVERCNGVDDDCRGGIDDAAGDTWFQDRDGDGFGDADTAVQ